MNVSFERVSLHLQLIHARHGVWPFVVLTLLALGLVVAGLLLPQQAQRAERARTQRLALLEELATLQAKPESARLSPAQGLARVLGDPAETHAQIQRLIENATGMGLQVVQADYRRMGEGQAEYSELQIVLPVRGTYPALRLFVLTALNEMPALSLEQLVIKREQSTAEQVEAQLLLSLWQRPAAVLQAATAGAAR